jgi:hypothetical protein
LSESLEELKAAVNEAERTLFTAKKRLREAVLWACPFHVGDEVEAKIRGEWKPAIVRSVETFDADKPEWSSYCVSLRKKNGEWGRATCHVGFASSLRKPQAQVA